MASAHEMFKLVELGAFSFYWDTDTEIYRDLPLIDLRKKMKHSGTERHEFILMPSNLHVHLKQNCSATSLQSLNQPRIVCDLLIDRLEVEVRHAQYVQCWRLHHCRNEEEEDKKRTKIFRRCSFVIYSGSCTSILKAFCCYKSSFLSSVFILTLLCINTDDESRALPEIIGRAIILLLTASLCYGVAYRENRFNKYQFLSMLMTAVLKFVLVAVDLGQDLWFAYQNSRRR
jgi:hypothetical protein